MVLKTLAGKSFKKLNIEELNAVYNELLEKIKNDRIEISYKQEVSYLALLGLSLIDPKRDKPNTDLIQNSILSGLSTGAYYSVLAQLKESVGSDRQTSLLISLIESIILLKYTLLIDRIEDDDIVDLINDNNAPLNVILEVAYAFVEAGGDFLIKRITRCLIFYYLYEENEKSDEERTKALESLKDTLYDLYHYKKECMEENVFKKYIDIFSTINPEIECIAFGLARIIVYTACQYSNVKYYQYGDSTRRAMPLNPKGRNNTFLNYVQYLLEISRKYGISPKSFTDHLVAPESVREILTKYVESGKEDISIGPITVQNGDTSSRLELEQLPIEYSDKISIDVVCINGSLYYILCKKNTIKYTQQSL